MITETIQTPLGPKTLHVCKDGDGVGDAWVRVYESAFPGSQRQKRAGSPRSNRLAQAAS